MKYEKPVCLDAGQVAAIEGALCNPNGGTATNACLTGGWAGQGACSQGANPTWVYACDTGTVADSNCSPAGGTAGASCNQGANPGWFAECSPTGTGFISG